MLPNQGLVVPLVFDDGGQAVPADLFGFHPLGHNVFVVADGAYVSAGSLGGAQTDAALATGEFHGFVLLRQGVDGLTADGAFGRRPLALVEDHIVAAVGAGAAGELVRGDMDGIAAGAVDFLPREEAGLGLRIAPTAGAFNYKFGHFFHLHVGIFYGSLCSKVVVPLLIIYYSTFRLLGNSLIQSLSFSVDSKICLKKSILLVA